MPKSRQEWFNVPEYRDAIITEYLAQAVRIARENVKTEPDHAGYPNHRADEHVRDLLEDVLHKSNP